MATTKVFMGVVNTPIYMSNDVFQMDVPWMMTTDEGYLADSGSWTFQIPIGSSPSEVYQMAFDRMVERAIEIEFPVPTKADVYTWLPMDFSLILPDPPPEAAQQATDALKPDGFVAFQLALHTALKAQADAYHARMEQTAGQVIFPPPKPLMYEFFYPEE